MRNLLAAILLALVGMTLVSTSISSAQASTTHIASITCAAPTDDGWQVMTDTQQANYWHVGPLTQSIAFTVPAWIDFVDYSFEGNVKPRAHAGDYITAAHEASAFCAPIPTPVPPTATPLPTPTVTPTPSPTPVLSYTYLPLVSYARTLPSAALCNWPSTDGRWNWQNFSDGSQGWHIGPLSTPITLSVPSWISVVYWSNQGNTGSPAHYPSQIPALTEATAFCR